MPDAIERMANNLARIPDDKRDEAYDRIADAVNLLTIGYRMGAKAAENKPG